MLECPHLRPQFSREVSAPAAWGGWAQAGVTLRWPLWVLVSCLWWTTAPPAPWQGTRALGPSGRWRCVSARLPAAGAPMPGSRCSRQSRTPRSAVRAVACGQGQLCREHGHWAVFPRGREVERLSGEGPMPRLGACVTEQVGSWLAGRCLFRAACGGAGRVSSLLSAQSRGPLAPAAKPGCICPA